MNLLAVGWHSLHTSCSFVSISIVSITPLSFSLSPGASFAWGLSVSFRLSMQACRSPPSSTVPVLCFFLHCVMSLAIAFLIASYSGSFFLSAYPYTLYIARRVSGGGGPPSGGAGLCLAPLKVVLVALPPLNPSPFMAVVVSHTLSHAPLTITSVPSATSTFPAWPSFGDVIAFTPHPWALPLFRRYLAASVVISRIGSCTIATSTSQSRRKLNNLSCSSVSPSFCAALIVTARMPVECGLRCSKASPIHLSISRCSHFSPLWTAPRPPSLSQWSLTVSPKSRSYRRCEIASSTSSIVSGSSVSALPSCPPVSSSVSSSGSPAAWGPLSLGFCLRFGFSLFINMCTGTLGADITLLMCCCIVCAPLPTPFCLCDLVVGGPSPSSECSPAYSWCLFPQFLYHTVFCCLFASASGRRRSPPSGSGLLSQCMTGAGDCFLPLFPGLVTGPSCVGSPLCCIGAFASDCSCGGLATVWVRLVSAATVLGFRSCWH